MQGMAEGSADIIDWAHFEKARGELGPGFIRILSYFREDGVKSVAAIEQAMRERDSAKLVLPSHTLKGESWQFGAERLAALAEEIEVAARDYVEIRQGPEELVEKVVQLRPLFEATLTALEAEASPLVERRGQYGSRTFSQTQFGRL